MKKTDATYLDTVVGRAVALGMIIGAVVFAVLAAGLERFDLAPAAPGADEVSAFVVQLAALGALVGGFANGYRARRSLD